MSELLHCPACGSAAQVLHDAGPWDRDGERFELARCNTCASLSTSPVPSEAVLASVYDPRAGYDYRWFRDHYPAKFLDALSRVHELRTEGIGLGPRLIDYGGGLGYFARAARLYGYDAATYDPVYAAGATAPAGPVDSIVMAHVLEHCRDLDHVLRDTRRYLRPGGVLVVAVPNAESEGYRRLGLAWTWAQPPLVHVHHFTARGLTALLERHGYRVERLRYRERWDANRISDIRLRPLFRQLDRVYRRSPFRPLTAAGCSLLRAALLGLANALSARVAPEALSELWIAARAPE